MFVFSLIRNLVNLLTCVCVCFFFFFLGNTMPDELFLMIAIIRQRHQLIFGVGEIESYIFYSTIRDFIG